MFSRKQRGRCRRRCRRCGACYSCQLTLLSIPPSSFLLPFIRSRGCIAPCSGLSVLSKSGQIAPSFDTEHRKRRETADKDAAYKNAPRRMVENKPLLKNGYEYGCEGGVRMMAKEAVYVRDFCSESKT